MQNNKDNELNLYSIILYTYVPSTYVYKKKWRYLMSL